jgi:hypothetical protein
LGIAAAAAIVPLLLWAGLNAIRYDDFTVARGGKAWVPFFKVLSLKTIDPANGPASRRLAAAIDRDVLTLPQYHRLHVDLNTYLHSPSNLEAIRLIALSDRDFGRGSNYSVLFDTAWETIRHEPRPYVDSVARTFKHFLWFRFSLEPVVRQPPPPPGPRVVQVDRSRARAPRRGCRPWRRRRATASSGARPTRSTAASSGIRADLSGGRSAAPLRRADRPRARWNSQLPLRNGAAGSARSWARSAGTFRARRSSGSCPRAIGGTHATTAGVARARGAPVWRASPCCSCTLLCRSRRPRFSIPLTPMFALVAVAAIFGKRVDSATVPGS